MKVRIIKRYWDLKLERRVEQGEELRVRKERALELELAEIIQEEKKEKENEEKAETPPGDQ